LNTLISNSFLGIFSIFCIVFLIQFFAYKRKEYLFYGIYLFVLVVYYFLFTTNSVFKDEEINVGIANLYKELISTVAIIFYTFFSIELLDLKKYSKKLYQYNVAFLLLNVGGLVLYPTLYYLGLPGHDIYYYLTLLFSPISFYLLYLSFKLKVPYTKYVIIGSIITTVGGVISIIMSIEHSSNSYWPGQFAMVMDVMLFFYATQKKVVDLQAENLQLRYKQMTELQSERQRISLELHDEVGGGLSTIFLMSELSKASGNDSKSLESISKLYGR
jgi:signal transduction histidine kinase